MQERMNINVSAVDYDNTSKALKSTLTLLEQMVHSEDSFVITDSEFAFGWHFYVVTVNKELIQKLAVQMGSEFDKLKGKGQEKKFLTWLTNKIEQKH